MYIASEPASLATHIALLAFTTDPCTTTALGSSGHEAEDLASLRPRIVVAPTGLAERASFSWPPSARAKVRHGARRWLGMVSLLGPILRAKRLLDKVRTTRSTDRDRDDYEFLTTEGNE